MKILHLAIVVITIFVIANINTIWGLTDSTAPKVNCLVHLTTMLHDPKYVSKAVQTAKQSPDFIHATKNGNFTYYAIYGRGQYDDTNCNNFFWLQTGVVFSDDNRTAPSYLIANEDPQLSGSVVFANCDDCPKTRYNDSFTPSLTTDQFIINNHNTTFGANYPPKLDASPLKQTEAGIFPPNVECRDGLHLLVRGSGAFCVKQSSMPRLVSMGWEDIKTYDIRHDFAWCQNYTSYISDKKVFLTCKGASAGQFNLQPPTYVMKHCPGTYGCRHIFWYEEVVSQDLLSKTQKERVVNMILANSGLANKTNWSLDRFLAFAGGNQWFADVQLFVSNGTANCGRYVQSGIDLQNLQVLYSFTTNSTFSVCKTAGLQSSNTTNVKTANSLKTTVEVR